MSKCLYSSSSKQNLWLLGVLLFGRRERPAQIRCNWCFACRYSPSFLFGPSTAGKADQREGGSKEGGKNKSQSDSLTEWEEKKRLWSTRRVEKTGREERACFLQRKAGKSPWTDLNTLSTGSDYIGNKPHVPCEHREQARPSQQRITCFNLMPADVFYGDCPEHWQPNPVKEWGSRAIGRSGTGAHK